MTFVPSVSSTPGYFGTYAPSTFPMPLKGSYSGAWTFNGGQFNWQPQNYYPGSVGSFTYYPYAAGPYQKTITLTTDTGILFYNLDTQIQAIKAYNTSLEAFNAQYTNYLAKIAAETARLKNIQTAIFGVPIKIPSKPCAPTLPDPYYGPMIDWWQTSAASINDTTKAMMGGVISRTASGSTVNSGFLQATSDIGNFTAEQIQYAGHTFGLYGQGNKTMP